MKKIFRSSFIAIFLVCLSLSFTLSSCFLDGNGKDDKSDKDSTEVKSYIDQLMSQYYYWADQMPSSSMKGKSVDEYFQSRLVSKDRWSWMMNGYSYNSMETGISTSYGFHISQPIDYFQDYDVYVTYVDKNSPLAKAGVTRGWQLTHIAGTDVETLIRTERFYDEIERASNKFTFKNTNDESVELNLTQTSYQSNSVTLSKIFTAADCDKLSKSAKVGYILYTTFNSNMKNEVISTLTQMKSQGVTDLILDLRYNGGGDLDLCNVIAGYLAPASADGKVFVTLSHNLANNKEDKSYKIKHEANSLDLDRLYVITGSRTASASESMINCLNPYIEVQTVGGQTYGKPNGMYVLFYPGSDADYQRYNNDDYSRLKYAFLPICFYNKNSVDVSIPDAGMVPDNWCPDDLYHDFGPQEENIRDCLTHIATGAFPVHEKPETKAVSARPGLLLPTPEASDPHYGLFKALP